MEYSVVGQLWNRVKRFARLSADDMRISSVTVESIFDEEDDALRNEIDGLSNGNESTNGYRHKHIYRQTETELQKSYRILDLTITATIEEIKSAYKKKIREVHPDLMVSKPMDEQEKAKLKSRELNSAYTYLKRIRNF